MHPVSETERKWGGWKKTSVRLIGYGFCCMKLVYFLNTHHQHFLPLLALFIVFVG